MVIQWVTCLNVVALALPVHLAPDQVLGLEHHVRLPGHKHLERERERERERETERDH